MLYIDCWESQIPAEYFRKSSLFYRCA